MSPIRLLKNEKALRGSWQKLWCSTMDCLSCHNRHRKQLLYLFSGTYMYMCLHGTCNFDNLTPGQVALIIPHAENTQNGVFLDVNRNHITVTEDSWRPYKYLATNG